MCNTELKSRAIRIEAIQNSERPSSQQQVRSPADQIDKEESKLRQNPNSNKESVLTQNLPKTMQKHSMQSQSLKNLLNMPHGHGSE